MSKYICYWDMDVVLRVDPRDVQQSGCVVGMGRKKQHPVAVIAFFLKFLFIFAFCLGCFAVWTFRCFTRTVFDLRGSICLCAAGASTLPRGRDNLGFAYAWWMLSGWRKFKPGGGS